MSHAYFPYRDLVGIDSPPNDHEPDECTLGPVSPAGWVGDAWKKEGGGLNSYFLRAWNKRTGQFAVVTADKYEAARDELLRQIKAGGTGKVVVMFREL